MWRFHCAHSTHSMKYNVYKNPDRTRPCICSDLPAGIDPKRRTAATTQASEAPYAWRTKCFRVIHESWRMNMHNVYGFLDICVIRCPNPDSFMCWFVLFFRMYDLAARSAYFRLLQRASVHEEAKGFLLYVWLREMINVSTKHMVLWYNEPCVFRFHIQKSCLARRIFGSGNLTMRTVVWLDIFDQQEILCASPSGLVESRLSVVSFCVSSELSVCEPLCETWSLLMIHQFFFLCAVKTQICIF